MTDGRGVVLARIRAALAAGPSAPVEVTRGYDTALPPGIDVVGLFAERVAEYRATVHRCDAARLPRIIADVLRRWGDPSIVVPEALPVWWLENTRCSRVMDDPPLDHETLDAVGAVITDVAVAIAETGTIVLDGRASQGRRAVTLLPDHHLCVVAMDRIVGTVPEALSHLDARRPLTWISGPSATSDIEFHRVEGVHGPRTLDVVIVEV